MMVLLGIGVVAILATLLTFVGDLPGELRN